MICRKCGKKIQDGFLFCPFCGAKEPNKEVRLVLRNTDWLKFADVEELGKVLEEFKTMSAEDLAMWASGMHENVRIFQISILFSNRSRVKTIYGFSVDETIKKLQGETGYTLEPRSCNLSNSFKETEFGKTWFRTREECEAAIKEIKTILDREEAERVKRAEANAARIREIEANKKAPQPITIGETWEGQFAPSENLEIWQVIYNNGLTPGQTCEALMISDFALKDLAFTKQPQAAKDELLTRLDNYLGKLEKNG